MAFWVSRMCNRTKSGPNSRLRGYERLEDRRLLASGADTCNPFADPITPEFASAAEQMQIDVGDIEPVRYRRQPRVSLLDAALSTSERYTLTASIAASINLEDTACRQLRPRALKTTGLLVFDYQNLNSFKFAGFDARKNLWMIGEKAGGRFKIHNRLHEKMALSDIYKLEINVDATSVDLIVNGETKVSHTYRILNPEYSVGLGTLRPQPTRFQDVAIEEYFPLTETVVDGLKMTQGLTEIIDVLANDNIAYDVDAALRLNRTDYPMGRVSIVNNQLQFDATADTFGREAVEYDVIDQFGRVARGQLNITINAAFPIEFSLDEPNLDAFELVSGKHSTVDSAAGRLHHLTGLELLNVGIPPDQFTVTTTVVAHPGKANLGGQLVFDYVDKRNFKYAGILAKKKLAVIAEVRNGRTIFWNSKRIGKTDHNEYKLKLIVNGKQVQLLINESSYISRQFLHDLTSGQLGIKGHRRGSFFSSLKLDDIHQPTVALNDYHKIPVHQDITLNHLLNLPTTVEIISASVAQGTVRIEDNQLIYRSAPHHWGPIILEYELQYQNGTRVSKTLPLAPGVSFPATAQLTEFGHLKSDVVMNDLGFHIQGKEFFQENQYPLPFGGFESITNFNMLFLDELLPENFDVVMQSRSTSRSDFAEESVIFDYRDQQNYKFVRINEVVRSTQTSTLIGTIVNSIFYPIVTFWEVGEVVNGEQQILQRARRRLDLDSNLNIRLQIRANQLAILGNGTRITSFEFVEPLNYGAVGAYSPYFERAYHSLSVVDPHATPEPESSNTQLAGDIWHEDENQLEVQPNLHGFSVRLLNEPFIGPLQIETQFTTVINTPNDLANGFVVFDYRDDQNFKLAGVQVGANSMMIGEVSQGTIRSLRSRDHTMFIGQELQLHVSIDQSLVTLTIDDDEVLTHNFIGEDLAMPFGFATKQSPAYFTNTRIG